MRFKRRFLQRVTIEMTPMIDCVFLLLIFFMVTSSIIRDPGIKVNLPRAQSAASQPDKDLVVTIHRNGDIFLNDRQVAKKELFQTLSWLKKTKQRDFLIVRGDEMIPYGNLVEVMDIARLAGIANVSLATRR
jgi:biopolymer transport protein ExbD